MNASQMYHDLLEQYAETRITLRETSIKSAQQRDEINNLKQEVANLKQATYEIEDELTLHKDTIIMQKQDIDNLILLRDKLHQIISTQDNKISSFQQTIIKLQKKRKRHGLQNKRRR